MIDNLISTLESLKIGLKVDNGSIKINAPKGTLSPEIIEDIKAHKNQLIKLLSSSETIPVAEKKEYYALTSSQRRLWTLSQLDDGNIAYNIFDAFQFSGELDINKLSVAFIKLIERHESLRTIFTEDKNGELGQYVIPIEEYFGSLKILDLSSNSTDEVLQNHSKTVQEHVFNLEKGPLFTGEVVKISDQEHVLLLNMHHIIGDGWSMGVLSREFVLIYNSLILGKETSLPALSIQYKDYAEWQNSAAKQLELEKSKSFWLDKFKGDLPILELPTSKIRPKIKTYNGSDITYSFSKASSSRLNLYAQQNEATLFMVLMAGINGLFSRYTNTRDIILGTPVAGREHTDIENQVGLYLNTLAIRTEFQESVSFKDLVSIEKTTLLNAYSHQEYPFDRLIDELVIKRDVSRSALFDVLIVFQNQQELLASDSLSINDIKISPYQNKHTSFSKFDISFIFSEKEEQLSLHLEYNTDVYELDFIEGLCVHLDNFITQGINNQNKDIATLNYLEASEKNQLFYDFNDTSFNIPDTSIIDLFVAQAAKNPEYVAVIHESKEFTYGELDEVSNELAHYLLHHYDLKTEDLVGVKLDRSEWLIISLLAVLKTGAAYVPIDPNYPTQRISYIEDDSKCKATIDEDVLRAFRSADIISNTLPEISITSDTLAYVIYTSGSTGKPKGVMITHKNASSLLHWSVREFRDIDFNILYAVTSHCFDLSVYEFFYPLSIGKSIRLLDNGLCIGDYLNNDTNVLINTVPSVIQSLLDKNVSFENVVGINLAGEAFPLRLAEYFQNSGIEVRNLYGPSEDTTYSSCQLIDQVYSSSVPIGKPIDNTQFYILSEALVAQPIGVIGEICISGDGLSRGYLNNPELTDEKFVNHPFLEGKKLYRTGDLGKWQSDGTILFMGRKDSQVKVRGHRIELGEIEHILEHQDDIDQAVVIVKELEGDQVLVAYLVGELVDKPLLREILSNQLPEYMVPNYFVVLDKLPLTPNGKIDKKALPEVADEDSIQRVYIEPVSKLEKQLVEIWEEVLGVQNIGITDNFFELGGHSLKIVLILNKIKKELGLELSTKDMFLNPTIKGITSLTKKSKSISIPKAQKQDSYRLTSSQQRLWVLSQFDEGSVAYNIPGVYQLKGNVNVHVLREAFKLLIDRHESLRTCFRSNDQGETRQYILPSSKIKITIPVDDLSHIITKDQDQKIEFILDQNNNHLFDLNKAPLITLRLIRLAPDNQLLVFNMHHIISDGWSIEVMSSEFMLIYIALLEGVDHTLLELPIQYKDYSEWVTGKEQQSKLEISKTYWLDKFNGEIPVLELPACKARPKIKTYNGNSVSHCFSKNWTSELQLFSERKETSVFVLLMAGINGLFSRYTNTKDIILGTPVAGRNHADLENQIGLYLNTLAIRTNFESSTSFDDLLDIQNTTLLNAYSHQNYPFDSLVDQLGIQRDIGRSPLFDIIVVLQNQQNLLLSKSITKDDLDIKPYTRNYRKSSQFDLSFIFSEEGGQLSLHLEYNTDIYEIAFIEKMVMHLENFIENCIRHSSESIAKLEYLSESEKKQLLYDFNITEKEFLQDKNVVESFVAKVNGTPDALALVFEGKELTYRELDGFSNQLAHYLLENYDLSKEDLIGVKLDRSDWLVISLLAVLKTGCAYVPIDATYPQQRIDYIEKDSNCKVIIDENLLVEFNQQEDILKTLPEIEIKPSNLAYVIYTSGSTGKPKGVMIEHKSLLNLCDWHISEYNLDVSSRGSLYAGIGFDASVWEIYPYLLSGGSLYPISNQEIRYDINLLTEFLRDHKITHTYLPTKICEELVIQGAVLGDTKILTGGEALKLPENINNLKIYNNYGPSENTVVTTSFDLKDRIGDVIPIGRPISNTQIYIISESLELQPIGVVGEICISGEGLSRGYLNREALTLEKFISHPFNEEKRLYRTGDLGKWLPNGMIEFSGRKDDQIKIRGYRIELGEIENSLLAMTTIHQAVVVDQKIDNEKVLAAYIVGNSDINKQELRVALSNELPEYMVPNYYIDLDELPLTSNGKIDKKALPKITDQDLVKEEYVAPVTKEEKQLVLIWEEILGIKNIGVTDNFFELGGHSLKMTLVVNEIKQILGLEVSIKDMFLYPTIRGIVSRLDKINYSVIPQALEEESYALSSSQLRLWTLSQFESGSIAYNIPAAFEFKGFLDINKFTQAFRTILERHESLRTVFRQNEKGDVRQYITDIERLMFDIDLHDLRDVENQTTHIEGVIEKSFNYYFNLNEAPLVKLSLIKVTATHHILIFNMHHIISDGWSMEILSTEFMKVYDRLLQEKEPTLPILSIQYKDYATWLSGAEQQAKLSVSRDYWLSKYSGDLPILELPTSKIRPKLKTYNGDTLTYRFSKKISTRLQLFAEKNGVSLFMVLMSGINGLFSRYTNMSDIVLGTAVAGRGDKDLENQIGLYLNTLAIRTEFEKTMNFEDLLSIQKQTLLDAYTHQDYPFDRLIEELNLQRDVSRSALFDVMVVLQNQQNLFSSESLLLEGLEVKPYQGLSRKVSQFDMSFIFSEEQDHLSLYLEYNTDIYKADFIKKMTIHLENFLTGCINDVQKSITQIHYLNEQEKNQLLTEFNETKTQYPVDKTIIDLFLSQVASNPEATALVCEDKELTYKELDELSDQFSNYLVSNYSIAIEDFIGVKLERNEWFVISLLAILKIGGVYVPIDPGYPEDRIDYIEKDCECKLCIDHKEFQCFIDNQKFYSKKIEFPKYTSDNLGYIMYTSGSTGKPKGVLIEQKSIVRLVRNTNYIEINKNDRVLGLSNFSFDGSTFDIFITLLNGATLVIAPKDIFLDLQKLNYIIEKQRISSFFLTTVLFNTIVESKLSALKGLKYLLFGGEQVSLKHVKDFKELYPTVNLHHVYGPTENTTFSTYYKIENIDLGAHTVPIGVPLSNSTCYVLDFNHNPVPIGIVGEICLGGEGLARGYLNRPELTSERFIKNPFEDTERLYKTGDLGKWLPDGTIEFVGRKDDQVKIRGHRIELGEIEYQLQTNTDIKESVVLVKDKKGAGKELIAYVVLEKEQNAASLRKYLSERLPEYMLPSYFVEVEKLPLTANGKVNKKALSNAKGIKLSSGIEYIAPKTDIEEKLAKIWEEVLEIEKIGITDNFFELGGHSLKATKLLSIIHNQFDVSIDIQQIFTNPTIEYLAMNIENSQWLLESENNQQTKKIII
ncbi:non-ribosomal peptide synthetase [uncultured Aquimarina sp.]|uniref:non-ribosomal peptide synthetase n=1 Tax=uncultured Aquimarina sp. TaxID=575652 RepID=UPI0026073933|nr:non-ribosomal peptide synthetase [uncultured Aquimarina sp.]